MEGAEKATGPERPDSRRGEHEGAATTGGDAGDAGGECRQQTAADVNLVLGRSGGDLDGAHVGFIVARARELRIPRCVCESNRMEALCRHERGWSGKDAAAAW